MRALIYSGVWLRWVHRSIPFLPLIAIICVVTISSSFAYWFLPVFVALFMSMGLVWICMLVGTTRLNNNPTRYMHY